VTTNTILTRGNAPLSAARLSEQLDEEVVKFRQQLGEMVDSVSASGLGPNSFREFTSSLRASTAAVALDVFVSVAEAADVCRPTIEQAGQTFRFRGSVPKQWLTPFGIATVTRRYYASDDRHGSAVPLDEACGMTDRFMTPEVEEMVAFASSAMSPGEVEQLLTKALPAAPSTTAIKRTIRDVGDFFEEHKAAVEKHVAATAPLNSEGPALVVSWDGVMVPVREPSKTTWKEAGVGRVSVYGDPDEKDGRPPLLDSRCFARMPESGMHTLIDDIARCVATTRAQRSIERIAVICDGKDAIWKAAEKCRELDGSIFILDFYHASQTLAGAANAIFGDGTSEARRWFEQRREQLMVDPNALSKLLRALRRYQRLLPAESDACDVVRRAIAHFKKNRRRMRYADFLAQGLPIGSGHVESAAKNLVAQRLKRSGMRWSCVGGQRVLNIRTRVKEDRWAVAWDAYVSARAAA
jgi:hypothetical protein